MPGESESPLPKGAIGRVGMVASLHRVLGEPDGRLVLLRFPVGVGTQTFGSDRRVFGWQALVLGEPVVINGEPSSDILVADPCLRPVSQLDAQAVERLVKQLAEHEFKTALADLAHMLKSGSIDASTLDRAVQSTADSMAIRRALDRVPVAVALREIGFRPALGEDSTPLAWTTLHAGVEVFFSAGPDMFGFWTIGCMARTERTLHDFERRIMAEEPRGKTVDMVLTAWQQIFGVDSMPDVLSLGATYRQHLQDVRRLELGRPSVIIDGEVLRATRRWLQRDLSELDASKTRLVGPLPDASLLLEVRDGLLRMHALDKTYAVPVWRGWMDSCSVSLRDLLRLPHWVIRGPRIDLVWTAESLQVQGRATLPRLDIGVPPASDL